MSIILRILDEQVPGQKVFIICCLTPNTALRWPITFTHTQFHHFQLNDMKRVQGFVNLFDFVYKPMHFVLVEDIITV